MSTTYLPIASVLCSPFSFRIIYGFYCPASTCLSERRVIGHCRNVRKILKIREAIFNSFAKKIKLAMLAFFSILPTNEVLRDTELESRVYSAWLDHPTHPAEVFSLLAVRQCGSVFGGVAQLL